jgi:hypothetical protein
MGPRGQAQRTLWGQERRATRLSNVSLRAHMTLHRGQSCNSVACRPSGDHCARLDLPFFHFSPAQGARV